MTMIAPLSLTTRVVNSSLAGQTAQWMARLQHRMSDLQTIAAFSLCPLRSWSTELRIQHNEKPTAVGGSSSSDNHASKYLKIDQWSSMGSGGFVWGGSRRLAEYLRKNGSQGFRKTAVVTTTTTSGCGEEELAASSPSPVSSSSPWVGLKVIELGAGTGALGLAIAAMGAHHVTLTDQATFTFPDPNSENHMALQTRSLLDLMKWNVQQNKHHFPRGKSSTTNKGNNNNSTEKANDVLGLVNDPEEEEERVQVREMLWGNDTAMLAALSHATYDVIVAADILLFEDAQLDLLCTLRHLSTPNTVIFIEHTDRSSSDGNTYPHDMLRFLELLARDTEVEWHPKVVSDHGRHLTICIERQ